MGICAAGTAEDVCKGDTVAGAISFRLFWELSEGIEGTDDIECVLTEAAGNSCDGLGGIGSMSRTGGIL